MVRATQRYGLQCPPPSPNSIKEYFHPNMIRVNTRLHSTQSDDAGPYCGRSMKPVLCLQIGFHSGGGSTGRPLSVVLPLAAPLRYTGAGRVSILYI